MKWKKFLLQIKYKFYIPVSNGPHGLSTLLYWQVEKKEAK
jgi:hypothetical protein